MKTYYVTHKSRSEDAFAICDRVNALTASNGDSLYKDRVEAEMIAMLTKCCPEGMTPWEIHLMYGMSVEEQEIEIDEYSIRRHP